MISARHSSPPQLILQGGKRLSVVHPLLLDRRRLRPRRRQRPFQPCHPLGKPPVLGVSRGLHSCLSPLSLHSVMYPPLCGRRRAFVLLVLLVPSVPSFAFDLFSSLCCPLCSLVLSFPVLSSCAASNRSWRVASHHVGSAGGETGPIASVLRSDRRGLFERKERGDRIEQKDLIEQIK